VNESELIRLGVAAVGGLAVGIEREWSAKREGEGPRFGGVRTFLLLGLIGGLAALASRALGPGAGIAILGAAGALIAVAYLVSAWQGTIDATTEVAGVVVLAAGTLAGAGQLALASAVFAATALVLVEKGPMHAAVAKIQSAELEAAARFAVLALVVLPLLPAAPIAAMGGIEPRWIWGLVLLFSGLSFAGYLALRAIGPERGLGVAGLLGGVVSSTAVTISYARESREQAGLERALAFGALAASVVLPARVLLLAAVLDRSVATALAPVSAAAFLFGVAVVARALFFAPANEQAPAPPSNPLRLFAAIRMSLLFAVVLWILRAVRDAFGALGIFGGALLLGLTDLDALTYSVTRLGDHALRANDAARALVVGMFANSVFKAVAALVLGARGFRGVAAAGLFGYAALFAAAFWWLG
jgi:uncharacterized membrane protein (DUF4010 family)